MNSPVQMLRRGQIVILNFDPTLGSEVARTRPAVIVSNNTANAAALRAVGVVTVVPLTSNTAKIFPFQVLLPRAETGLPSDSKAQAEQVRAVSVDRVSAIAGWVPGDLMFDIDEALRLHLSL